jgi:hypothetical protein
MTCREPPTRQSFLIWSDPRPMIGGESCKYNHLHLAASTTCQFAMCDREYLCRLVNGNSISLPSGRHHTDACLQDRRCHGSSVLYRYGQDMQASISLQEAGGIQSFFPLFGRLQDPLRGVTSIEAAEYILVCPLDGSSTLLLWLES